MPSFDRPNEIGNAGRPAAQTPNSGAFVATLDPPPMHAVSLLMADHREAESLFGSIRQTEDRALRDDLVHRLVDSLTVHMQVEEDVFYPPVEHAGVACRDVKHGRHEHEEIREKIEPLLRALQDGESIEAPLDALEKMVNHHVSDEEDDMFPKLDAVGVDWTAVGLEIAARKDALRGHRR